MMGGGPPPMGGGPPPMGGGPPLDKPPMPPMNGAQNGQSGGADYIDVHYHSNSPAPMLGGG
jgi:hypothetical protein